MKYVIVFYVLFMLSGLFAFAAHAGNYVGVGYVDTDYSVDDPLKSDANGGELMFGRDLNNISAVEITLTDYGTASTDIATQTVIPCNYKTYCQPQTLDGVETLKVSGQALGLWGVLHTDNASRFDIYGKLGVVYAKAKATLSDNNSLSDSGFGVGGAVGITADMAGIVNNMSAFLEYRAIKVDMDFDGTDIDFEPRGLIAGIRYQF